MKKVILSPNPYRDKDFQTVRTAQKILQDAGIEGKICLPFEVDRSFTLPRDIHFCRFERECHNADTVICFGGDGTILYTAKAATRANLPVLGINIGTMGFMAELESTELEQLKRLAVDDYTLEKRMMLDVSVYRDRSILFHDIGLNDAVISKGAIARIVHMRVTCDNIHALECSGDGVIVATPTGSTAYSLSAGGPIVEPEAKSMVITPICAHDIVSRSIIASDERVISVELIKNPRRNAFVSVDGGKAVKVSMGDKVVISRSNLETKLIRLKNHSFYDVVNMKFRR